MRIFDVDQITPGEAGRITDHLMAGEVVRAAFRAVTNTILFTERRILTLQRQVLLAERIETSSFSYRSVRQFSLLQGSEGESRSEIRIWIGADPHPLHLRANPGTELGSLQLLLAEKLV